MNNILIQKAIEEHGVEQTKIITRVKEIRQTLPKGEHMTEFKLSLLYLEYDLHNYAINKLKESIK